MVIVSYWKILLKFLTGSPAYDPPFMGQEEDAISLIYMTCLRGPAVLRGYFFYLHCSEHAFIIRD